MRDTPLLPLSLSVASGRVLWTIPRAGDALPPIVVDAGVMHRDGRWERVEVWHLLDDDTVATIGGAVRVTLHCDALGDGVRCTVALTNDSTTSVTLEQFELHFGGLASWWPLRGGGVSALRVAYCGAHSRSHTSRSYVMPLLEQSDTLESWWVGAVSGARGPGLVVGGMRPERFVTRVDITRDSITAVVPLEQWTLSPGESLMLDPLWIGLSDGTPHAALERFAQLLGAAQAACVPQPSPGGWGSWGHWLERIDAGLMREMVHAIDGSARLRRVIDIVQIDDGWSELLESRRVSASWRPNARFPSGLAPLATEIERSGRRCGLWLLPFAVNEGSPIILTHPEWLVQDAHGAPLRVGGGDAYCLDPTHPGAAAWLRELLHGFTDWGIDYIKLDFLRALLAPDPAIATDAFRETRRYHAARTRLEAYRRGLAVIREAVGDATTIVACSAPAAAGVGFVDCHRVGPDIEREWTGRLAGVRDAARAVAANWFWHGRTWVNDPDYLLVCESEELTQFWATVVALSGGSVIVSADITTLEPWAEAMCAFILPAVGRAARPVDLFEHGPEPRRWVLPFEREGERWTMLGLLNWGDTPTAEKLTLEDFAFEGAVHVWDAWRQRHSIARTPMTVPIGAQAAALLRLTPVTSIPTVVGSDIHWAQGWVELTGIPFDSARGELRLVPTATFPRPGRIWIWIPDAWSLVGDRYECTGPLLSVFVDGSSEILIKFTQTTTAPLERTTRAS